MCVQIRTLGRETNVLGQRVLSSKTTELIKKPWEIAYGTLLSALCGSLRRLMSVDLIKPREPWKDLVFMSVAKINDESCDSSFHLWWNKSPFHKKAGSRALLIFMSSTIWLYPLEMMLSLP